MNSSDNQKRKRTAWRSVRGPLITLVMGVLVLIGDASSPWLREAHMAWVLLVPVAYAASIGGLFIGLISAFIAIFFSVFDFVSFQGGEIMVHDLPHLIIFMITAPFLAALIGVIKQKSEEEVKLRELKEESYQSLFESIEDIYYLADVDGKIEAISPSITMVAGFSESELIGQEAPWISSSGAKYARFLGMLQHGDTVKNHELKLITKDGASIDVSASARILVKDGRQMIEGILRDITASKQADRARAQNQKQITAIASSATDAIITINEEREIIFWNSAAEKIFGYSREEVIGQLVELIIPKSFIEAHRQGFKRLMAGGEPHLIRKTVEVEALAKDGHEFPIELSMASWVLEGQSFFTSIIRDITDRKQAEQDIKESEERLEILFDNAPEGYVLVDLESRVVKMNAAFEAIFGIKVEEFVGKSLLKTDIFTGSQLVLAGQAFSNIIRGRGGDRVEFPYNRKTDGAQMTLDVRGYPVKIGGKTLILVVTRDITDLKKAQNALVQKLEYERVIGEVSALLIKPIDVGSAIDSALKTLGEFANPTRVVIFLRPKDQEAFFVAHEWHAQGVSSLKNNKDLPVSSLSWLFSQALNGKKIEINNPDELPEEARAFQQALYQMKVESLLTMPLYNKGVVSGFIGFDNMKETREWQDDDRRLMDIAAQIIGGALELKEAAEEIKAMAFHDPLTHLANRRLLEDRLNQALSFSRRRKEMLALFFFDIDGFKAVNDEFGHDVGDQLLQEISRRLQARVRSQDTVARLGGDEFNVVLSGIRDPRNAADIAKELINAISAEPFSFNSHTISVSVSVGISIFPLDGETSQDLTRKADIAMYNVKKQGGNDFQLFQWTAEDSGYGKAV